MTAASSKPVSAMARLHLGCGESLSQLLPAGTPPPAAPAQQVQPTLRRGGRMKSKRGGGK